MKVPPTLGTVAVTEPLAGFRQEGVAALKDGISCTELLGTLVLTVVPVLHPALLTSTE